MNNVCAAGIHFFLTKEPAYFWNKRITNGKCIRRYDNGQISIYRTNVDGKAHGEYKEWFSDGQPKIKCTYDSRIEGMLHGKYEQWYCDGQLWIECTYRDGKKHGEYKSWYKNNQFEEESVYVNGNLKEHRRWLSNGLQFV